MAGETKLLGTLQLNAGGVLQTIDRVNDKLKSLGQGVDLDLTNIVNAKLTTQLETLKKQISEVSKAATGVSTSQRDQVKQAISLMKEQYDLQTKIVKQGQTKALADDVKNLQERYSALTKNFSESMLKAVQDSDKVRVAMRNYSDAVERAYQKQSEAAQTAAKKAAQEKDRQIQDALKAEQKLAAEEQRIADQANKEIAAKREQQRAEYERYLQERSAAQEKAAKEHAEKEAQYNKIWAEAEEAKYQDYLKAQAAYHNEAAKAEQAYYDQVRDTRLQIIDLQKQLEDPNMGANQRSYLEQQLNEKIQVYNNYSTAIRQQVETDSKVAAATAEAGLAHIRALDQETQRIQQQQEQYANRIGNLFVSKVGMAVISTLKEQWSAAIDYAKTYYDTLNEIRVITTKTEAEANTVGNNLRQLAQEMKVTSTELSQAAVTFYRQGLSDAEVNKRLEWVTKYAKIANIDFSSAAELITAAANSMSEDIQGDIERIVDVFVYLGDSAATSGEEIGKAMQKASASATEFGLSFEWLGAYIATVSEQTRQAPESIGNAFNTMLARMHQIKQKGFNDEDTTKLNDVAKALATINVELFDSEGNWRDMSQIYQDVAEQWDTLDAKQRGYLATTMANVRQQNVFYALMNDMAKGIDGGSRAWELYTGAMNAAGTATEKYAIYQESVEAAQANLQNSLESLYASLSPNLIKDWYNGLAGFVDLLAKGTEAAGGFNVAIGVVAGGMIALAIAIAKAGSAAKLFSGIMNGFAMHPVIAGIMATVAVIMAVTAAMGTADDELQKVSERLDAAQSKIELYTTKQNELNGFYGKLKSGTSLTNDELETYNTLLDETASLSPAAKAAIDDLRAGIISQAEAMRILNGEYEKAIQYEEKQARYNAREKQANANFKAYTDENKGQTKLSQATYEAILQGRINENYGFTGSTSQELFDMLTSEQRRSKLGVSDYIKTYNQEQQLLDLKNFMQAYRNSSVNEFQAALSDYFTEQQNVQSQLKQQADEQIDTALLLVDQELSSIQEGYLRQRLMEHLLADDGSIDLDLLDGFGQYLLDTISIIADDVVNNKNGIYRNRGLLDAMINAIFANDTYGQSVREIFKNELDMIAHDGELTNAVVSMYESLLGAGLSKLSLQNIQTEGSYSLNDWGDVGILSILEDYISSVILGFEDISDYYALFTKDVSGDMMELDTEAQAMIINFTLSGKSIQDFIDIFNDPDVQSLEDFKNRLKEIGAAAQETSDTLDETPKTAKEYISDITSATSQIEKLQEIIDSINAGEPLDMSKVLDIAESNPEILMYIRNLDMLKQKLQELKDQQNSNMEDSYRNLILNSETAFSASKYGYLGQQYGVKTLNELMTYFGSEAFKSQYKNGEATSQQQIAGVNAEVEYLVGLLIDATDAANDLGDALEDIEPDDSAENAYLTDLQANLEATKNYAQWIAALDKTSSSYDPTKMLDAYIQLESIFPELKEYERGTADYMERAKQLVAETTAEIYAQAAAWGVVTDLQAKMAQYADAAQKQKTFQGMDSNTYLGAINYLEKVMMDQRESEGEGIIDAWKNALKQLDEQGVLQGMVGLFGDIYSVAEECGGSIEDIIAKLMELRNVSQSLALNDLAQQIKDSRELNRAQTEDYQGQVSEMLSAMQTGGIADAMAIWNSWSADLQNAISNRFPSLILALNEADQAAKNAADGTEDLADAEKKAQNASKGLERELKNIQKNANAKYFTNTAKAIDSLNKGTMKVADAYADFNKEAESAVKAQAEFKTANLNFQKGIEVSADDVKNLASYLGDLDPEWLLSNWDQVGPMLSAALAEGEEAFNRLNEAAFINITGTSSADFSAIQNGLISVQNLAQETIDLLIATGQWDLETIATTQKAWVKHGDNWILETQTGSQQYLKPSGNNPFKGKGGGSSTKKSSGGGGGGGGGGGKKDTGPSEVEILLDRMQQIQDLQNHSRSLYSAQASYYMQTGELQGVIKYYQKEIDLINEQNKVLEQNVAELDTWIKKKKAEVDSLDKSTDEYATASDELKDLQKRHQEYTLELINNRTEVDKLTESIKEQNKAIRDMEIDLRNTILQAIEDREALNERMLQGQIELEEEILGLIQIRYEKERDLILKNAQKQIDALQKERDLLSEQLQMRKEQADQQAKAVKLAELEQKYARISADPTRKKEMLSIEKQIKELREEIAWDLAEQEVEAQQKAIDEQIESIDDYMTYVENYYEDLFEHPKKLIEEMKTIIMKTDAEIIEWLKENSDDYAKHTEAAQTNMVKSWQQMIDDMHGAIKTYWDEVESIIEQGDEAIIEFLKANSADYRAAGKLQAEAYVDEWMDKLEKLRLAHKQVTDEIEDYNYNTVEPSTGSGSSGGGGGGGGGSTTPKPTNTQPTEHGYQFTFDGKFYKNTGYASEMAAANAGQAHLNSLISQSGQFLYQKYGSDVAKQMINAWGASFRAYKQGGLAYNTGLAWIDGTPSKPERILSSYQTELFEALVRSLESISRVTVPSMPFIDQDSSLSNSSVSVGDIVVNVDKMDTDADYEAMAEKVFNTLMDRLNRGAVVGGIRFSS